MDCNWPSVAMVTCHGQRRLKAQAGGDGLRNRFHALTQRVSIKKKVKTLFYSGDFTTFLLSVVSIVFVFFKFLPVNEFITYI